MFQTVSTGPPLEQICSPSVSPLAIPFAKRRRIFVRRNDEILGPFVRVVVRVRVSPAEYY